MAWFEYSNDDLKVAHNGQRFSKFDKDLRSKWDQAMEAGHFRYDLSELKTKVVAGPHQYVALVSPADYAHSLIVPQVDENLNQNLSQHGIKLALDVMCLSASRSFRVGFNSLCAHASVNHQHLHCYYTDQTLLAERLSGTRLSEDMYLLDSDAPTGYGFELSRPEDIKKLSRALFSCTDFMRRSEIAHALFLTRGSSFDDPSRTVIRALLWPRKKLLGPKPSEVAFNSAVLEMAGHLLIKDKTYFEDVTDESAYRCLKEASLPDKDFDQLTMNLLNILSC